MTPAGVAAFLVLLFATPGGYELREVRMASMSECRGVAADAAAVQQIAEQSAGPGKLLIAPACFERRP